MFVCFAFSIVFVCKYLTYCGVHLSQGTLTGMTNMSKLTWTKTILSKQIECNKKWVSRRWGVANIEERPGKVYLSFAILLQVSFIYISCSWDVNFRKVWFEKLARKWSQIQQVSSVFINSLSNIHKNNFLVYENLHESDLKFVFINSLSNIS